MLIELLIAVLALAASLSTRPWRLLAGVQGPDGEPQASPLLSPLLATLVLQPWLWALPALHADQALPGIALAAEVGVLVGVVGAVGLPGAQADQVAAFVTETVVARPNTRR